MPTFKLPKKLQPILTTKKRFVVLLGGRGSGKSQGIAQELTKRSQTEAADILCCREIQNSIDESVHKLIKGVITNCRVNGFKITDKKIDCLTGGGFRYRGLRTNTDAVKSAQDFKYAWVEEAQSLSKDSIKDLTPTIRAEGSQLFFTANPQSSADPFSQRFINPYLSELQANGIYEDDLHLIIMINWRDNPWFPPELEQERQWDFDNLDRAEYDHIWEGAFNDSVENSLIRAEWFDACIDAHKKLGFEPRGMKLAAHDPSDMGEDTKGYAYRHGSVVLSVEEKADGDINEGCDWATGMAINDRVDSFTWDVCGMGAGLKRDVTTAFDGKHTRVAMFNSSESADNPDAIYKPVKGVSVADQKTNKQTFKNKRAQYYVELRDRVLLTYKAINGQYADPDKLISFSSDIIMLVQLRSELCRMPIKPNGNGLVDLYSKPEMKSKFGIKSPNLADSVMMLMRQPHTVTQVTHVKARAMPPRGRR